MINDSMPRTIAQLKDGTLIDDVQLGAVLGVSPLDNYDENPENDPDSLMLALAYGNEGQHYKVLNGEVVWLTDAEGNSYAPRTIKDLKKAPPSSTTFTFPPFWTWVPRRAILCWRSLMATKAKTTKS